MDMLDIARHELSHVLTGAIAILATTPAHYPFATLLLDVKNDSGECVLFFPTQQPAKLKKVAGALALGPVILHDDWHQRPFTADMLRRMELSERDIELAAAFDGTDADIRRILAAAARLKSTMQFDRLAKLLCDKRLSSLETLYLQQIVPQAKAKRALVQTDARYRARLADPTKAPVYA